MTDIHTRKDIEYLVDTFYEKVLEDDTIGYIFTDVAMIDLKKHMPVMYDFWETVLLGNMIYKGNPMITHIGLNKKSPLKKVHFDKWLELWEETVHDEFSGPKATEAITKANQLSDLMQHKIDQSNHGKHIL